jgi:hypothetical protein
MNHTRRRHIERRYRRLKRSCNRRHWHGASFEGMIHRAYYGRTTIGFPKAILASLYFSWRNGHQVFGV